MASEVDKVHFILPVDQPVVLLDAETAFNGLSEQEKSYAHNISQASWIGGLITLLQTSPESGPAFVLFHKLFLAEKPEEFKRAALEKGIPESDVNNLFVYVCGVLANAGNYKGFGDTKIIPNLGADEFENLLKISSIWASELEQIWTDFDLKNELFSLEQGKCCLGFPPQGITTYLSKNCTAEDNEKVQNWVKTLNLECYNTRLFKTEENGKITYEVRCAGEEKNLLKEEVVDGIKYQLTSGDYSPLMKQVAEQLKKAVPHAANENQAKMLEAYARSFTTGSLDDHKDGSRFWIKDKGPAVESYIGFIETYRDPAGVRGEFEGFVAIVNREMSVKFADLVSNAEKLLPKLPWSKHLEKDRFLKPDFTSLDVLTFAGSGIPAGINIPNYDCIRQNEGFKNVSLGNVITASYQATVIPFLTEEDVELLQKWKVPAFEVQVGLHELLGHGSGKLFRKEKDGTFNFPSNLLNPLTGAPISSYYEASDSYDTRFGSISSAVEECRAEAVGLYLSLDPEVLEIFGHEGEEAEEVLYANWLSLVWIGAGRSLEMWEPGRGWLQAHSHARYVLAQVLIQAGIASVTQPTDGDLLVSLDRSAIQGAGRNAIGNFLLQLQVYKATGDFQAMQKLFEHYGTVKEPWTSWRSIILAKKQPRKIFTQSNTVSNGDQTSLRSYEASTEGFIQSWIERFESPKVLHEALLQLSREDKKHF